MCGRRPTTWREAARSAGFRAYRPVEPAPDFVWLGGFGFEGAATGLLGISASLDGGEIEIDTAPSERFGGSPGTHLRAQIANAIWHHLLSDDVAELTLPFDVRVDPADRPIRVDGADHVFNGFRVVGSTRWTGSAIVGDLWITVRVTSPADVLTIVASDCDDLEDSPPPPPRPSA